MDSGVAEIEEQPEHTAASGETLSESGVFQAVQLLWNELYRLSYDHIRLAALETQRAGESLVTLIVAAIMIAFFLSGAWLGLMAVFVLGMVDSGVIASSAILLAVALNLLLALLLCGVIRRKRHYLQFPATLQSLHPTDTDRRVKGKS
jgi:uncharacterized membrane protein YqjE